MTTIAPDARSARPTVAEVRAVAAKDVDAWWTVLVVDPLAVRLVRLLAPVRVVTPDRLTALAAALGVLAAIAFGTGHYAVGAVLFETRFVVDCLDGKLARVRRRSSAAGGFFDISSDVALTAACYAAALGALVADGTAPVWLSIGLPAAFLYQYWTWLYLETAGRDRGVDRTASGLRGALARRRLALRPRSVDVEAALLFVVPLITVGTAWVWLLTAAAAYYLVGTAMNWWRVVRLLNSREPLEGP